MKRLRSFNLLVLEGWIRVAFSASVLRELRSAAAFLGSMSANVEIGKNAMMLPVPWYEQYDGMKLLNGKESVNNCSLEYHCCCVPAPIKMIDFLIIIYYNY